MLLIISTRQKNILAFATLLLLLLVTVSVCGLAGSFIQGMHGGDYSSSLGYDLVMLLVIVPVFYFMLRYFVRGVPQAAFVIAGLLAYIISCYCLYLPATELNFFLLLDLAIILLAVYLLINTLTELNHSYNRTRFDNKVPVEWKSAFILFMAVPVLIFESRHDINLLLFENFPAVTTVFFGLFISTVLFFFILAGVLLRKRETRGYILGVIVLIKAALFNLVLIVMAIAETLPKFSGFRDPLIIFYLVFFIGSLKSAIELLRCLHQGKLPARERMQ